MLTFFNEKRYELKEVRKMDQKPSCFKCGADLPSFTFIDYPVSDKLVTMVFCRKCGAVQGIVAKER